MATYLPLVLSVKCKPWRKDDNSSQEADSDFSSVRRDALARDKYACRFCGFVCKPTGRREADYYMQVHHRDDDHHNNSLANLVTACMHCHACQHIGLYGQMGDSHLVWLPEIPQWTLHHVLRTILVARRFADTCGGDPKADTKRSAKEVADACDAIYARILMRKEEAEKRFKTSNPADLASALMNTPNDAYQRRTQSLAGLRLLLTGRHELEGKDIMPSVVDAWLEKGPYVGIKPPTWVQFLRSLPPVGTRVS